MDALGSISQLYMFILLVLLFVGVGFAVIGLVKFLTGQQRLTIKTNNKNRQINNNSKMNYKQIGGFFMNSNNGWLKLAAFSFVGILISVIVSGLISTGNTSYIPGTHNANPSGTYQNGNMNNGMQQQMNPMNNGMGGQNNNMGGMGMMNGMQNMPQQNNNNGGTQNMPQNGNAGGGGMGMM